MVLYFGLVHEPDLRRLDHSRTKEQASEIPLPGPRIPHQASFLGSNSMAKSELHGICMTCHMGFPITTHSVMKWAKKKQEPSQKENQTLGKLKRWFTPWEAWEHWSTLMLVTGVTQAKGGPPSSKCFWKDHKGMGGCQPEVQTSKGLKQPPTEV